MGIDSLLFAYPEPLPMIMFAVNVRFFYSEVGDNDFFVDLTK